MKIGLFFGSFNPVHVGHLVIANYMVSFTDLDELWFVVSPQNPLKEKDTLLKDSLRLEMLRLAVKNSASIKVSDVEFSLSRPSYTINTLKHLQQLYPENTFIIIMGADGLSSFHKWKDHKLIEENYRRYVYPRKGSDFKEGKNCILQPAPEIDISSTFIRQALKEKKDVRFFLPEGIYNFIKEKSLYL